MQNSPSGFHPQQRLLQTANAKALCQRLLCPPLNADGTPHRDICLSGPLGTGKTTLILKCIHYLCMTNRIDVAIARNEKTTLYASIIPTMRNLLRHGFHNTPANPIHTYGGEMRPQEVIYKATGSRIFFTGVDDSDKLFGNEYTIIFLNEARRMNQSSYTDVAGRLRKGGFLHPKTGKNNGYLLISDTNPDHPEHWLKQRERAQQLTMMPTQLHDNALYYYNDEETEEGRDYRLYLERTYTGFDHDRYVKGLWVAAEGLVYPMFSPATHVRKMHRHDIPPSWHWCATLDYGWSVACYVLWAYPPERQSELAWAFKAIYHGELQTDDLWEQIYHLHHYYQVDYREMTCYADHDPGASAFLRKQNLHVVNAKKQDSLMGIDAVKRYLWQKRLVFNEDILAHYPDMSLKTRDECINPLEEFGRYHYPEKKVGIPAKDDEPVPRWNHFLDNVKYKVRSHMDVDIGAYSPIGAMANAPHYGDGR